MRSDDQLAVFTTAIRALQRRAEAMAQGDLRAQGQPVSDLPVVEDLRRAIDVLGAHTEQGLRSQHAYVAALSTAQEAERSRLARELHDDIVQQLIALGHGVDRVQRLLERDPSQVAKRLQIMRASITELVDELRAIIGALRPPALDELGLLPAVELLLGFQCFCIPYACRRARCVPTSLTNTSELSFVRRNRSELLTTNTDEKAIAPAAMIGLSCQPVSG